MKWLRNLFRRQNPAEDLTAAMREGSAMARQIQEARDRERFLTTKLAEVAQTEAAMEAERAFRSMSEELVEARAIAGAGPWKIGPEALNATENLTRKLRESFKLRVKEDLPMTSAGATGDIDLMLSTLDWRREINFSVLQFSRWGIQQIILIVRLYYLKNPIVRRLIDVCAAYVFARGVEVTTSDEDANDVLNDFFARNKKTFGQIALTQTERMKDTDGNIFWCLFADKAYKGETNARIIDATEICEMICNPDDAEEPWLYLRIWTQQMVSMPDGVVRNETQHAWYPDMGYEPDVREPVVRGWPVIWEAVIHHRKCGQIGKWQFGCPRMYPAIDWAREARRYLEACASVAHQLAQIALTFTTKGGQQALTGFKQQMGTTVGPTMPLWDTNPPAVAGGIAAMGTGSKLEAFKTSGAGINPKDVGWFTRMCCMVAGVPSHFIGDVEDTNRATATSLDRPTETGFLERQEAWVEDLTIISQYVLQTSAGAPSGRLAEAFRQRANVVPPARLTILECRKKIDSSGKLVYEAFAKKQDTIEIQVNFPAIREGDVGVLVDATIKAGTLGASGGQILGIDEKELVKKLYDLVGIEKGDEIAEAQYPSATYTADRTYEMDIVSSIEATIHAITLGNRQGEPVGIDLKEGIKKLYQLLGIPDGDKLADAQFPKGEYDPDRTKEILPPTAANQLKADVGQPITTPEGEAPPPVPTVSPKVAEALARVKEALNGH